MNARATVHVDFHLSPDGDHTLAPVSDVAPSVDLHAGDPVTATDGDVAHPAIVDHITEQALSLVVLWDEHASAALDAAAGASDAAGMRASGAAGMGASGTS